MRFAELTASYAFDWFNAASSLQSGAHSHPSLHDQRLFVRKQVVGHFQAAEFSSMLRLDALPDIWHFACWRVI